VLPATFALCQADPILAMESNCLIASSASTHSTAARFSRKWATEEVPGISRMVGASGRSSQGKRDLHGRCAKARSDVGQS